MPELSSLAIRNAMIVCNSRGRAFPQRRTVAGLAADRGDAHHRLFYFIVASSRFRRVIFRS